MAYTDIDDPSAHFQAKVYTGSNSNQSITNDGNSDLQPDWIFASYRTLPPYTNHRAIIDSSRGRAKILESDTTAIEATTTLPAYDLVSFDTNGFTVGPVNSTSSLNASGISNVAWQWKANGGTTSSNTDGDITSTVQVNSDAGFSIITDSPPNNTARSIGHGLGKTPTFIIRRARNRVENWRVLFNGFGTTGAINLDGEGTYNPSTLLFNGVTSTTFGVGTDFSVNGNYNYITYCFTDVQGYSKSGKYIGNGSVDGPFVYTGFKPAWVIIKANSNYKYWNIFDNKRNPFNGVDKRLAPSLADAEDTVSSIDFLSNGFKIRNSGTTLNESGTTIAYFAVAENPFVTSTGIPTTAR